MKVLHRLFALLIVVQIVTVFSPRAEAADIRETVAALLFICVGGGSEEKLEADGKIELALTLKKLRSGDIGGLGEVGAKFTKAEWQGLVGGIGKEITEKQADQANEVRKCLKPYMDGIIQAILKAPS